MNEGAIGTGSSAPPEGAVVSSAVDSPPTSQGSGVPDAGQIASDVTAPVQGTDQSQTQPEADPLAGLPTLEELQAQVAQNVAGAKGMAQLRGAYDALKPQLTELTDKFKPFESVAERFTTPEEVQQAVEWHDKLFGAYERVDGQLVPATEKAAQDLAARDPLVADYLAADLMNGMTRTDDGREISRFEFALEIAANDPQRKAAALKILGGVEPSSIAPTWQPTAEELEVVRPELQDIYKTLPYDERENLKLNDPQFINKYLADQKFKQDLMDENRQAKELQTQQQQQREAYFNQQAEAAGNAAVETGFRQLFTEYAQSVVENSKFIAPLDPNSPEAQAMAPEQVAEFNKTAQRVNTGVGKFIALATAALSVPDTAWIAQDFLKELGVPDEVFQKFNAARGEYANNTRDYGELNYRASQQNGNGNGTAGLGALQTNARGAANQLKGHGNLISKPIKELFSALFEMKAGNYNATLNGAATARPPVNGQGFNPATAPSARPNGFLTKAEIEQRYG